MERYLLFGYDSYYPCGGWGDFKGSYKTYEEAEEAASKLRNDHFDIVDGETGLQLA